MSFANKPEHAAEPASPPAPAAPGNSPRRRGNPNWVKGGPSPNPSGRPKEVGHVKELARQHTEEAIRTLADIMRRGKPDRARVAAAEALLDRAWGRPEQAVVGQDGGPVELTLRILRELADQARGEDGQEGA